MPLTFAAAMTDATYWSGWDKVGAVAVCLVMLAALLLLHRAGLRRVDKISDRHIEFVEAQTKVLTELVESNRRVVDSNDSVHERMDGLLNCTRSDCAVFKMRKQHAKEKLRFEDALPPAAPKTVTGNTA